MFFQNKKNLLNIFSRKPYLNKYILILAGIIVYYNSFSSGWVLDGKKILEVLDSSDGYGSLTDFLAIKGASYIGYFGWFSFYLNQFIRINGVWEFHLINLIIHITNSFLIYKIILLTSMTPYFSWDTKGFKKNKYNIALLAGIFFVVHPLASQSVTYLYQRITSLACLFYFLSFVFYIKSRLYCLDEGNRNKSIIFFLFSFIAINLGLYTKYQLLTLPVIFLLYEFYFFPSEKGDEWRKRIIFLLPFVAAVVMRLLWFDFYLINFNPSIEKQTIIASPQASSHFHVPRLIYLISEFRVVVTYLRLMLFPVNQTFLYDYPYSFSFFEPSVFISFISLFSIMIFSLFLYKRLRVLSFSILWFFINIAPTSTIVPERWIIFEHRMYLASAGVIIFFSLLLVNFHLSQKDSMYKKRIIVICIICLLFFYSTLLIKRNYKWTDEIVMLEDMVKKAPNNVLALSMLGSGYFSKGDDKRAEQSLKKAISLHPSYMPALQSLTGYYIEKGRYEEALKLNELGLKFKPNDSEDIKNRMNYLKSLIKKR